MGTLACRDVDAAPAAGPPRGILAGMQRGLAMMMMPMMSGTPEDHR